MRPLDLYRLGLRLAQNTPDELHTRTAINRIYYGLHHEACRRYFRRYPSQSPIRQRGRHKELVDRYASLVDQQAQTIKNYLAALIDDRVWADYELDRPAGSNLGATLFNSQVMLQALEEFSPGESTESEQCKTI